MINEITKGSLQQDAVQAAIDGNLVLLKLLMGVEACLLGDVTYRADKLNFDKLKGDSAAAEFANLEDKLKIFRVKISRQNSKTLETGDNKILPANYMNSFGDQFTGPDQLLKFINENLINHDAVDSRGKSLLQIILELPIGSLRDTHKEIIKFLLRNGAHAHTKGKQDKSPYDLAVEKGPEWEAIFKECGIAASAFQLTGSEEIFLKDLENIIDTTHQANFEGTIRSYFPTFLTSSYDALANTQSVALQESMTKLREEIQTARSKSSFGGIHTIMTSEFDLISVHTIKYSPLQLFKNKVGNEYQRFLITQAKEQNALVLRNKDDSVPAGKLEEIERELQLSRRTFQGLDDNLKTINNSFDQVEANMRKSALANQAIVKAFMFIAAKIGNNDEAMSKLKVADGLLDSILADFQEPRQNSSDRQLIEYPTTPTAVPAPAPIATMGPVPPTSASGSSPP